MFTKWIKQTKRERYQRISSCSPNRWYSMYKLASNALKLRLQIEEFIGMLPENVIIEKYNTLTNQTWRVLELSHGILATFRNAVQMLESDDYGTVSHIFEGHQMVNTTVAKLGDAKDPECPNLDESIDAITDV
jgi:hypothetical protein